MSAKELSEKILNAMRADASNTPKAIAAFLLLVANDYTDCNNLEYFLTLYNALCRLESEGLVEDTTEYPSENVSNLERIKKSEWRLVQA